MRAVVVPRDFDAPTAALAVASVPPVAPAVEVGVVGPSFVVAPTAGGAV
jgi:hypothetical protein